MGHFQLLVFTVSDLLWQRKSTKNDLEVAESKCSPGPEISVKGPKTIVTRTCTLFILLPDSKQENISYLTKFEFSSACSTIRVQRGIPTAYLVFPAVAIATAEFMLSCSYELAAQNALMLHFNGASCGIFSWNALGKLGAILVEFSLLNVYSLRLQTHIYSFSCVSPLIAPAIYLSDQNRLHHIAQ